MSYQYKRISNADANSTVVVCATPCELGHVTINTTSAHALTIKDTGVNYKDDTVATIAASPAIGSVFKYEVDILAQLKVVVPASYAGDATIAFKPL